MFPPEWNVTIAVYHLSTTTGTQSYTLDSTITTGALLPMDSQAFAFQGGDFANPRELYVSPSADVRESDKVIISGVTYYIRFIFDGRAGGLAHKRCTLSTDA